MWVKAITADHFRGVQSPQTLRFADGEDHSVSVLLVGDNGTGKSSFIDALEFALQGLCRDDYRDLRSLRNMFVRRKTSRASVRLDDNSVMAREITWDAEGNPQCNRQPHRSFSIAPFVLRRSDILRFWQTPPERRQMLLIPFVRDLTSAIEPDTADHTLQSHMDDIDRRRDVLARARNDLICKLLEIDSSDHRFPRSIVEFDELVRHRFYRGLTTKKRAKLYRAGMRFEIPQAAEARIKEIRDSYSAYADLRRARKKANSELSKRTKSRFHAGLSGYATAVAKLVSGDFARLSSNAKFVREVRIVAGELSEISFEVLIELYNGTVVEPRRVLSEANLDLLSLLIYLGMIREAARRGQAKLVVLDDVLQSIDQSVRVRFAAFLISEFADWQVVFSVHDQLWRSQLVTLLRKANLRFVQMEITDWSVKGGPVVRANESDQSSILSRQIDTGTRQQICTAAGILLERICDRLSVSLPISVLRRPGDRYTLGDLWPGIQKKLKRTTIVESLADVDRTMDLRNMIGAHYNEWAESLSRSEACEFGKSVLVLYSRVRCGVCFRWIEPLSIGGRATGEYRCRCGAVSV